jgi:CRISPR/Cas system CMR subunit Cmr4 (Cas7 group RAMP superfamily)
MNFAQLFQNIQKKDPSKLSVSEMALMVRFNTLKERLEDEESVMSALENEFNIAEQVRTNASASATTTGTGSAKEFVPENVLMTSLIDLGDKTEDYSFL